jgi:hypothetical protein
MRVYTCRELSIPHADLVALVRGGGAKLGIGNATAETIARTPDLQPKFFSFKPASPVRNWIAVGIFALSVYLAIIEAWWHIAFGLAFMLLLGKNTRRLNIEKILAAAEIDTAFYEQHRGLGNWLYRMDEEKAATFLVANSAG